MTHFAALQPFKRILRASFIHWARLLLPPGPRLQELEPKVPLAGQTRAVPGEGVIPVPDPGRGEGPS